MGSRGPEVKLADLEKEVKEKTVVSRFMASTARGRWCPVRRQEPRVARAAEEDFSGSIPRLQSPGPLLFPLCPLQTGSSKPTACIRRVGQLPLTPASPHLNATRMSQTCPKLGPAPSPQNPVLSQRPCRHEQWGPTPPPPSLLDQGLAHFNSSVSLKLRSSSPSPLRVPSSPPAPLPMPRGLPTLSAPTLPTQKVLLRPSPQCSEALFKMQM